jgi:hypothetical protein
LALWNGQLGEGRGGVADMVACGRLRSADIVTLDTVALFGLSEVPGDQPAGTHVTSGDAIDRAEVRAGAEPPQLAAEQVGPLGGTVGAPATVAESNSSDQGAAPNTTASKG